MDADTGLINYERLEENALLFRPKIIVAGVSCYSRHLNYARFRGIADKVRLYTYMYIAFIHSRG